MDYSVNPTNPAARVGLYLSTDLVNWSTQKLLIQDVAGGWDALQLRYPVFMNKTGDDNENIDLDDFYIIGSASGNSIGRLHLKIAL